MRLHGNRMSRLPAALAVCALVALTGAPTASAHAVLETTDPANGTVLAQPPGRVSLRFNEPVETSFGAIRVYDASARRVDSGEVERPSSSQVATPIDSALGRGTYTVTWRVVSADAHPVSGAFVFHVGEPGAKPEGIAAQLDEDAPEHVSVAFTFFRFMDFAFLLAAVGGSIAMTLVLRDATPQIRSRLAAVLAAASAGVVLAALGGIVLQGAVAGGFGIRDALRWNVVSAVLDTRFGRVWLAQALIAAALAGAAILLRRRAEAPLLGDGMLVLAAALVLTPPLVGHASVSGTVAFLADVAHVQAAAAWTGGLAFLVVALWLAGAERWSLAASAVPRFSAIALISVTALLVAGSIGAYLEVGAWRGLWDTTYGLLLLAKIGLVLPLIALGAYNNRRSVPRLRAQIASRIEQRRFLRAAGAELVVMIAVVAVTAVLISQPPAKAQVAPSWPFSTITQLGELELNVVVDPAVAGANDIHLYITDRSGRPVSLAEARLSARLPSRSVGPLRLPAHRAGPGHLAVHHAHLALAGDWQLTVEARRGEFESLTRTVSVPIRKES